MQLASLPWVFFSILFFSSRAAYNVVKGHSGNASSAVTKYPYPKHISRACNPTPTPSNPPSPPNPGVTFSNNLAGCRKNFCHRVNSAASAASLCRFQIILWLIRLHISLLSFKASPPNKYCMSDSPVTGFLMPCLNGPWVTHGFFKCPLQDLI